MLHGEGLCRTGGGGRCAGVSSNRSARACRSPLLSTAKTSKASTGSARTVAPSAPVVKPARIPLRLRPEAPDQEVDQRPNPGRRRPTRRHHGVERAFLERKVAKQGLEGAPLERGRGDEAGQDADPQPSLGRRPKHLAIVGAEPRPAADVAPICRPPGSATVRWRRAICRGPRGRADAQGARARRDRPGSPPAPCGPGRSAAPPERNPSARRSGPPGRSRPPPGRPAGRRTRCRARPADGPSRTRPAPARDARLRTTAAPTAGSARPPGSPPPPPPPRPPRGRRGRSTPARNRPGRRRSAGLPARVRVSSRAPSCASRRATRRDRIDFDIPIRSAARLKAPVSATRTKARTSSRSTEERSIMSNTIMRGQRLQATQLAA